jgi:hypothetical protein
MIDWGQHYLGKGVDVIFTPRSEDNGNKIREELIKHIGSIVKVKTMWLMNNNDPYPGEWALGSNEYGKDIFGRTWIASGDVTEIMEFASKEEANEWMEKEVDDPCIDNYRFAFLDNESEMIKYEKDKDQGCCGVFDQVIKINGRKATIGCNYGH